MVITANKSYSELQISNILYGSFSSPFVIQRCQHTFNLFSSLYIQETESKVIAIYPSNIHIPEILDLKFKLNFKFDLKFNLTFKFNLNFRLK